MPVSIFLIPSALAQGPTKIQLAFENEYVQVVNIHYGPPEKSAHHSHPGGVVVVPTGGHLKFTDEKGKRQEIYAKPIVSGIPAQSRKPPGY